MLSFAQRSQVFSRINPLARSTSLGLMGQQTRRNVSLLINDQFLDDDQKMI